jgi:G3E family GTPase
MTPQQIAADVDRLIVIKAQIADLTAEAKTIESRLENAALHGEQIPLQDSQREGKQFLARGSSLIVPIRFEADNLVSTFKHDSELHKSLKTLLGATFEKFFKEVHGYDRKHKDDANKFRKFARKELQPDAYAALIKACLSKDKDGIPKSKTVIALADAKPLTQVATI